MNYVEFKNFISSKLICFIFSAKKPIFFQSFEYLGMEAKCLLSSNTFVSLYKTTQCHPENYNTELASGAERIYMQKQTGI
jgi:hypothetical protein